MQIEVGDFSFKDPESKLGDNADHGPFLFSSRVTPWNVLIKNTLASELLPDRIGTKYYILLKFVILLNESVHPDQLLFY